MNSNSTRSALYAQRAQRAYLKHAQLRAPLNSQRAQSGTIDVFLSFRGIDVRYTFVPNLNKALVQRGVNTFLDDMVPRGVTIWHGLVSGIETSKISIVIISENYVSSIWCLDELMYILECRERQNQLVLPVFFKVDPSEVRRQTNSFELLFEDLEERFINEMKKVQMWREALTKIGNLSGFHWKTQRTESEFIDEIAECVVNSLSKIKKIGERHDKVLQPPLQQNLAPLSVAFVTEAQTIRHRGPLYRRRSSLTPAHQRSSLSGLVNQCRLMSEDPPMVFFVFAFIISFCFLKVIIEDF